MLSAQDPHNLGYGRDVRDHWKTKYSRLSVQYVWEITQPAKSEAYNAKKQQTAANLLKTQDELSKVNTSPKLDCWGKILGLDGSATEKVLMHGTKPQTVVAIIQNGLNERVSGGLFGKGAYLAEDASKIDQYCTPDPGPRSGDDNIKYLHEKIYDEPGLAPRRGILLFCSACCLGPPCLHSGWRDLFALRSFSMVRQC